MRARLSLTHKLTKQQQSDIKEFCSQEMRRQEKEHTRRMIKIFCIALHEQFGFGTERCLKVLAAIDKLSDIRNQDEVFWYHIDRELNAMGLDFEPEDYEKVDL